MCPDQQTGETERDAVQFVSRAAPLPQYFGHDAEHGASVQSKGSVRERIEFNVPKLHARFSQDDRITIGAENFF